MSARSLIAFAMLSSLGKVKGKYSDIRSRDERQAYERRISLFSGRGIVCLGGAPRRSERKESQY